MSRQASGSSTACLDHDSGTSMVLAIGALRPARTSTSNTESSAAESEDPPLRMVESQVTRLEAEIDAMNATLEPLRSFILPGGSSLSAHLHLCRTVARRAERLSVELSRSEDVNPQVIMYLNRLSDWFFVAARIANDAGKADVLWVPGANR